MIEGVELPGMPDDVVAMVVAHPCVMRTGVHLADRITCVPVRNYEYVAVEKWATGYYRQYPLPLLDEENHSAAFLSELTAVESTSLTAGNRLACLERRGIYLLQQRVVNSISRVKVELPAIKASMEHVLEEADLQEDWVEQLCSDVDDGDLVQQAISDFSNFLDEAELRPLLIDDTRRTTATRTVSKEIARRRTELRDDLAVE